MSQSGVTFRAAMTGIADAMKNLDKLEKELKYAARHALIENALHLLSEAVRDAPIYLGQIGPDGNLLKDENGKIISDHTGGKLRASGTVLYQEVTVATGSEDGSIRTVTTLNRNTGKVKSRIEVLVGFNTVYAMEQHENLSYRHIDGKAKYLEDNLRKNNERFLRNVNREIRKAMEKHAESTTNSTT